jgi:putative ABC transport system ATP-binding protein
MSVIKAVGVTKSFDDGPSGVEAVRGIDLSIEAGEMVAIVGPSGSGKSTLLTMLGAIDTPTTGKVLLDGVDIATLGDDKRTLFRRRRIGFVFQAFNLIPTLTALENVALPLELDDVPEATAIERAKKMLDWVSLSHRADHLPNMMSGGEQQRAAVARALVHEPALILADEPTGNLDSVNSQAVMKLLRDLVDQHGQTVVIVTHDMLVAADADRIIHVRDGMIQYEETLKSARPVAGSLASRTTSV